MFVVSQSYPQRLPSDDRTLGFDLTVRAAYVVILAITGAIWCLIVLGMRTYLRIFINGPFGWDDYACMAATLFACISATLTLMQVHFGLGEHVHSLDAHAQDMIHIMSYINAMAYLLALTFSILSICMLIERITSSTKQALLSCIVGIMTCGWAITTIFVVAFQCPLPRPWLQGAGAGCMNTWIMWQGIVIAQVVLEFANAMAALILVRPLSMPFRTKVVIMVAFSSRFLLIPPTIVRLIVMRNITTSKDWTYDRSLVAVITQIILHSSVILATVPCLKPWFAALEGGGFQMTVLTRPHVPNLAYQDTHLGRVGSDEKKKGYRKESIDEWQRIIMGNDNTMTTIQYSPQDAWLAARRRSVDATDPCLRAITRMDSFSVTRDDDADEDETDAQEGDERGPESIEVRRSGPLLPVPPEMG